MGTGGERGPGGWGGGGSLPGRGSTLPRGVREGRSHLSQTGGARGSPLPRRQGGTLGKTAQKQRGAPPDREGNPGGGPVRGGRRWYRDWGRTRPTAAAPPGPRGCDPAGGTVDISITFHVPSPRRGILASVFSCTQVAMAPHRNAAGRRGPPSSFNKRPRPPLPGTRPGTATALPRLHRGSAGRCWFFPCPRGCSLRGCGL